MSRRNYQLGKIKTLFVEFEDGMRLRIHEPRNGSCVVGIEVERLEHFTSRSGMSIQDLSVVTRTEQHLELSLDGFELEIDRGHKLEYNAEDFRKDLVGLGVEPKRTLLYDRSEDGDSGDRGDGPGPSDSV